MNDNDVTERRGGAVAPWLGWPSYRVCQIARADAWRAYLEQEEAAHALGCGLGGSDGPLTPSERRAVAQVLAATGLWLLAGLGQPPRWAA